MSHYETFKDKAGEYRWRLIASNGEPVAASEAYTSKADAQRGIEDAHTAALEASQPTVKTKTTVRRKRG